MADILLINAPTYSISAEDDYMDLNNVDFHFNGVVENHGLLYVGASLKQAGYSYEIIDANNEDWSLEEFVNRVLAYIPTLYIGFSINGTLNYKSTAEAIKLIRNRGIDTHITAGGIVASQRYRKILDKFHGIDSVVVGDGEETAVYLANAIQGRKDWKNISGIASRSIQGGINFIQRKFINNLDTLPVPDRQYYYRKIKQVGRVSIDLSRGCSGQCKFCNLPIFLNRLKGKNRRSRDPKQVIDEIEKIVKETGVNRIIFIDFDFIGSTKSEIENCISFAREIIKRDLEIKYSFETKSKNINNNLISLLRDSGLEHVNLGIESWADSQLKRYGKGITRKDNLRAVEILGLHEISFYGYLIPIDPYVNRKEIMITLKETGRIGLDTVVDIDYCKKMAMHEDSHFYQLCQRDNLIKKYDNDSFDAGYDVPYYQRNKDVEEIVRASDQLTHIYYNCRLNLRKTGSEKELPSLWNIFYDDVLKALKKKMFKDFKNFVENTKNETDGQRFMGLKYREIVKDIFEICENITRDRLENFNDFSIVIDSENISTRLKEVYKIPINY